MAQQKKHQKPTDTKQESDSSYTPNPNIKIVLNGGKHELDTATVPVKWHFSDELIAKNPEYIMIADHAMSLQDFYQKNFGYCSLGYRHWFKVSDFAGYIQLHHPGRHHFIVMVFYGEEEACSENMRTFLKKDAYGGYLCGLDKKLLNGFNSKLSCETAAVEFEVPEELFAKRSKSPFAEFVWRWVNRWYEHLPVDQCAYRKRMIFAFTVQPPLFLIGRLLAGISLTLYAILGSLTLLFLGFRPMVIEDLWKNVRYAWADPGQADYDLFCFRPRHERWRLWYIGDGGERTRMPVWAVPWIFLLLAAVAVGVGIFVANNAVTFGIIGAVIGFFYLILRFVLNPTIKRWEGNIKQIKESIEAEKTLQNQEAEKVLSLKRQARLLALKQNLGLEAAPPAVDIKKVIPKVKSTVTRFRLSFWAAKAKVCRPFAR